MEALLPRILYLTGSARRQDIEGTELDMSSTQDAADNVLSGEIRVDGLHGFLTVDWATIRAVDCTEAVALILADEIRALWLADSDGTDAHIRAVIAWVEGVLHLTWDGQMGAWWDDKRPLAWADAPVAGIHYHTAAE